MDIELPAARFRRWMTILVVLLTALSFAGVLSALFMNVPLEGFIRLFNVDEEESIPNWYSSVALAFSALLLAAIAAAARTRKPARDFYAWTALTCVFTILSLDEIAELHHIGGKQIERAFHLGGFFRFAWVIPALAAVSIMGALFLPFVLRLPARRRLQFIVAGMIFVGGTVGMEMVGAKVYVAAGERLTLLYAVCFHIEEFMEMFGIVLFNAALIEELAEMLGSDTLRVRFTRG